MPFKPIYASWYSLPRDLLAMARLANFADIYGAEALSQLAYIGMYRRLAETSPDDESIVMVIELVEIVYDNFQNSSEECTFKGKHVLRRLLAEYVAVHRTKFLDSPAFNKIAAQRWEFISDVLYATTLPAVVRTNV
jgi:hypothetical protein